MEIPLVTIVVLSYNSSTTVIETLESIYNQTYQKIELIISDDCSSDDTLIIAADWLKEKEKRFVASYLLPSDKNRGISANANKGLYKSSGMWIKYLAADDALLPNFVSDNISFLNKNPSVQLLLSVTNVYQENFESKNYSYSLPGTATKKLFELSAAEQHLHLLKQNFVPARL